MGLCLFTIFTTTLYNIISIKTTNSSVPKIVLHTTQGRGCIKTFCFAKKFPCLQISVSSNLEWSCQRCTSVVVPVYGMLPWGGGWGNAWLKTNVVPMLGQHWDFASINNHYSTACPQPTARSGTPHTAVYRLYAHISTNSANVATIRKNKSRTYA